MKITGGPFGLCQIFCTVAASLAAATVQHVAAQQSSEVPPSYELKLREFDKHTLTVPPFRSVGIPQCDARGNAYFGVMNETYHTRLVLRVSSDGQKATPFLFPKDLDTNVEWHFSISPDGEVYALASNESTNTLVQFSDSGDELRRTTLQLPLNFSLDSFAVQANSRIAIRGKIPVTEPNSNGGTIPKGNVVTLFLDQTGKRIRREDGPQLALIKGAQGALAPGRVGTFLELNGTTLNTYDLDGHLEKSFELTKPREDSTATKVQYVDGQIAVEFAYLNPEKAHMVDPKHHPEIKTGPLIQEWAIVDAVDGTTHAYYKLPPDFVGSSLCSLGNHEFLNYTIKNGQASFVDGVMP